MINRTYIYNLLQMNVGFYNVICDFTTILVAESMITKI